VFTSPKDEFITKSATASAVEAARERLRKAFAENQRVFFDLVCKCQGRQPSEGFVLCAKSECSKVPSSEDLRKYGQTCPSCSAPLVERRASRVDDCVPDEAELDDHMTDDERRRRGVAASATGVPFGPVKSKVRAVKSASGGRLDGQRID